MNEILQENANYQSSITQKLKDIAEEVKQSEKLQPVTLELFRMSPRPV